MTDDNSTRARIDSPSSVRSSLPFGIIPRVQPQKAHQSFVCDNPFLDTVMLNIDYAERLLNQGKVFSTYFDDRIDLITTSTIHDEPLGELQWRREENIVRGIGSDYHIPTDYWVYGDMEPEDRIGNIELMMEGTRWFHDKFSNSNTTILPLASGVTTEERAICYRTIEELDLSRCVFYGSQFFGGEMGNGIKKLNSAIRSIVSEYDIDWMMVIGQQTGNYLARFPPEVQAAAGNRWIDKSGLRDHSRPKAKKEFGEWKQTVEKQLGSGTRTLGSFVEQDGVVV